MQAAGIPADAQKIQREDYVEYRVRIPMNQKEEQMAQSIQNRMWKLCDKKVKTKQKLALSSWQC